MGRWNRRYVPRSNRRGRYQDYDWSPPRETYRDPEFGVWQDNVPLWEKKFCFLAGVPWERVLSSKNFLHCHSNVVDWDDAASKEAFYSAKEQYWAKINGDQNEVHLPGPDLYIDDVDWNPYIDPELVKDLDRTFFAPDDDQRGTRRRALRRTMVNSGGSSEGRDGGLSNDNTLGCVRAQASETMKEKAVGWNQWGESVDAQEKPNMIENSWKDQGWDGLMNKNDGIDNSWERYHAPTNPALKEKGTGWSQRDDQFDATVKGSNNGDPWECPNRSGGANVEHGSWGDSWSKKCDWKPQSYLDKAKTTGDHGNKWRNEKTWQEFGEWSRGRNHWEPGMNRPAPRCSSYYHDKISHGGPPKDTKPVWGKKQSGQYGWPRRDSAENRDNIVGINRKREGSDQYGAGHKGPRLQYMDQTSRGWNSGSNHRRVSFAGQ